MFALNHSCKACGNGAHADELAHYLQRNTTGLANDEPRLLDLLRSAVTAGHAHCVACVLSSRAALDLNAPLDGAGSTALLLACAGAHVTCARVLLEARADPTRTSARDGMSPILVAAQVGDVATSRVLIEAGVRVEPDESAWLGRATPMALACAYGHVGVVRLLIERKADPNHSVLVHEVDDDPDNLVFNIGAPRHSGAFGGKEDTRTSRWKSLLTLACIFGQHEVARQLIHAGAILDQEPLIAACRRNRAECVRLLLTSHDEVARGSMAPKACGALHFSAALRDACMHGAVDVARVLIDEGGVNVESARADGWTPLKLAADMGQAKCMRLLIERGADVEHAPAGTCTALIHAAAQGHLPAVQLLLRARADPNARAGAESTTPLLGAASSARDLEAHMRCLRLLLQHVRAHAPMRAPSVATRARAPNARATHGSAHHPCCRRRARAHTSALCHNAGCTRERGRRARAHATHGSGEA